MNNANLQFRYGLRMRPPALGAVPTGFTYEPSSDDGPNTRHGVAVYDRMLTPDEVRQYELVPLSGADGHSLELPRLPLPVLKQVTEAIDAFRYMEVEIAVGNLSRVDCEDHVAAMTEKLAIFQGWAACNGVHYERAIAELGGLPEMFADDGAGPGDESPHRAELFRPRMTL